MGSTVITAIDEFPFSSGIMSKQGKMERNSKVCVEVQNDEKCSRYAILGSFIFQNRRYELKGAAE